MQRVTLVRYTAKAERADENEALSRAVFVELRRAAPEGVAYAVLRDGDSFIHLFVNLRGEASDAVTELPSFKAYTSAIAERCVAPPDVQRLGANLLESYGLERTLASA